MKDKVIFVLSAVIFYQNFLFPESLKTAEITNGAHGKSPASDLVGLNSTPSIPMATPFGTKAMPQSSPDAESFLKTLNQSLAQGLSLEKIAFGFLAGNGTELNQRGSQFKLMAEWMQTHLKKSDSLIWATFAQEWISSDPAGAQAYLAGKAESNEFLEILNADLQRAEAKENYQSYLEKVLAGRTEEVSYLGISIAISAAYQQQGPELRNLILQPMNSNLSATTQDDLISSFYTNLWENEKSAAIPAIERFMSADDIQDREVRIILNTGYANNHDEFLKWFREHAPKIVESGQSDEFYQQFLAMDEADREWLLQAPAFRSFELLKNKSSRSLALNSK